MSKYKIIWTDYSRYNYGQDRRLTVSAKSISDALAKLYKKHPKARCPSITPATVEEAAK